MLYGSQTHPSYRTVLMILSIEGSEWCIVTISLFWKVLELCRKRRKSPLLSLHYLFFLPLYGDGMTNHTTPTRSVFWNALEISAFFKIRAWSDPGNLRKSEARTHEKRGITIVWDVVSGYVSNFYMQQNWHHRCIHSTLEVLHQFSFFFALLILIIITHFFSSTLVFLS